LMKLLNYFKAFEPSILCCLALVSTFSPINLFLEGMNNSCCIQSLVITSYYLGLDPLFRVTEYSFFPSLSL
jgi:hypothetical protein